MDIAPIIQRAAIEEIWDAAVLAQSTITVESAFKAARSARWVDLSEGGGSFIGISDKGTSISFASPSVRDLHPNELLALTQFVVERARVVKAANPSYTEPQIIAAILASIVSVRRIQSDFSNLCH